MPYKSPSCSHDLGGKTMRGMPLRKGGEIIGVKRIRVNCLECKGMPIT